jgi:hypothetical protein
VVVILARGSASRGFAAMQKRDTALLLHYNVVNVGRNANNGTNAGVFYVNSNNDSSNRNRNIGTQLYHHLKRQALVPDLLVENVAIKSLVGSPKRLAGWAE